MKVKVLHCNSNIRICLDNVFEGRQFHHLGRKRFQFIQVTTYSIGDNNKQQTYYNNHNLCTLRLEGVPQS
jgi:hypothetical protein